MAVKEKVELPQIKVERIKLYHGSSRSNLKALLPGEEYTIGHGIYLTSDKYTAKSYALVRSREGHRKTLEKGRLEEHVVKTEETPEPVVYEADLRNLKLVDIRSFEKMKQVMAGFQKYLVELLEREGEGMRWNVRTIREQAVAKIDILEGQSPRYNLMSRVGKPENIAPRDILFNVGEDFSDYCENLGYDGIIGMEGGETTKEVKFTSHDSYVIFDPKKVKITEVIKIGSR